MKDLTYQDPSPLSFDEIVLPPSTIDKQSLWNPFFLYRFIKKTLGFDLEKILLPQDLTGKEKIPSYALVEFHNLPNGYYSKLLSGGYTVGFNVFMLGTMKGIRKEMANEFVGCESVLDLGCGGGSSSQALHDAGVPNGWGLDPSPYLLSEATQKHTDINFIQGSAENTGFAEQRFDGISASWLFHEIPPHFSEIALQECFRILKPGGKLVIMEPSEIQLKGSYSGLFKNHGWKGFYFHWLANFVFEPFVKSWQAKDIKPWLEKNGFEMISNELRVPEQKIVARKL